jgi:hypothetical protein
MARAAPPIALATWQLALLIVWLVVCAALTYGQLQIYFSMFMTTYAAKYFPTLWGVL